MKIDVIIPCYKAHKTLPRLLGSVLSQTIIDDLKVTLVNDGDEKDYQQIVKSFKSFMDIQELKLEKNSGPGTARRFGYENTYNPLVIWADADDTFAISFAMQRLREGLLLDESNAICIGDFVEEVKTEDNSFRIMLHQQDTIWMFGKLYKREFLDRYDLKMNDTKACEDCGFNTVCRVIFDNRIKCINDLIYVWHLNKNSITHNSNYNYNYDVGFKGYVDNMIWAFEEIERIQEFYNSDLLEQRVMFEKVQILINLYGKYVETKELFPEYEKQNWQHCKRYYNEVYKSIKEKVPREMISNIWREHMIWALSENRFSGFIPAISIYQFLDLLKEQ